MAKISRDSTPWKVTGVIKRDYNHTHSGDEIPKRGGKKRKKDTKRWCRGKEGKEHVWDVRKKFERDVYYNPTIAKCEGCGKEQWLSYDYKSNKLKLPRYGVIK